jgi:hypothetical protein
MSSSSDSGVLIHNTPGSKDQWIQAILLVEGFELVPKAFWRGSKTKNSKLGEAKPTWHLFWRENKLVWTKKTVVKGELLIWRTKNQIRDQGIVQLKDSICFKSIQIGS